MCIYSLSHLSDRALLRDLAALVAQDRATTAVLLAHIAEVDERRLYLPAAYDAGLRWYDEIVAIDGKPLEKWTREEVDRLLEEGEVGSVHRVTYRRLDDPEQTVEVTLKDVL